jgi:hypothetical protein
VLVLVVVLLLVVDWRERGREREIGSWGDRVVGVDEEVDESRNSGGGICIVSSFLRGHRRLTNRKTGALTTNENVPSEWHGYSSSISHTAHQLLPYSVGNSQLTLQYPS